MANHRRSRESYCGVLGQGWPRARGAVAPVAPVMPCLRC
eukprot:COSAG01_NODE_56614_length_318_cov_0.743119_1_plen_38_part_10